MYVSSKIFKSHSAFIGFHILYLLNTRIIYIIIS